MDLTGLRNRASRGLPIKTKESEKAQLPFLISSHLKFLHMWGGWKGSWGLEGVAVEKEMRAEISQHTFSFSTPLHLVPSLSRAFVILTD